MKNGWLDEENRAYIIYSVDHVMEDLGCSKPTCIKIMKELDSENGIGLMEKKRRGLGKPDIIYVKNFASAEEKEGGNTDNLAEVKNLYFREEKNFTSGSKKTELQEGKEENPFTSRSKEILPQEVKKSDLQRERNFTSGSKKTELQEVKESAPNYNNTNYNNQNYTDLSDINPINQSEGNMGNLGVQGKTDVMDRMDETSAYMALIRNNLEYEHHMKYDQHGEREIYEEIYEIVCDVVCVKR